MFNKKKKLVRKFTKKENKQKKSKKYKIKKFHRRKKKKTILFWISKKKALAWTLSSLRNDSWSEIDTIQIFTRANVMSYISKKKKKKKKKGKFVFPLFLHILLSKYCACLDKFCNDRYWIMRGLYCEEIDNKGISMIHDHLQALFLTCSRVLDEWIHMIRKNSIPPSFARPRWTFIASFSLRKKKKKSIKCFIL